MHKLFLILSCLLYITAQAQINFEKGYFISSKNEKTECLIKNVDWENNPNKFKYKLDENSDVATVSLQEVKEISIGNYVKYIKATVGIDRSPERIGDLSKHRVAFLNEETLFLKVLLEGKASLFEYRDNNLKRFFYKKEKNEIQQLIFKKYKRTSTLVGENNRFRQQIWSDLKCSSLSKNYVEDLKYDKRDLISAFEKYNNRVTAEYLVYDQKPKPVGDFFNLNIRPRVNYSSLTINRNEEPFFEVPFDSKLSYGIGAELEFIFPFRKNKWAFVIEPTYQHFSNDVRQPSDIVFGGEILASVNYNTLELPLKARHYFYINDNQKIFINASYIFEFALDSSVDLLRNEGPDIFNSETSTIRALGFGIGYKYHDKYSAEIRYRTQENILSGALDYSADYSMISFILGYTLF